MIELQNFKNDGFGWICVRCNRELNSGQAEPGNIPRAFREGEAESKSPTFANPAMARWTDKTRRFLSCPRCGVTEDTFIN